MDDAMKFLVSGLPEERKPGYLFLKSTEQVRHCYLTTSVCIDELLKELASLRSKGVRAGFVPVFLHRIRPTLLRYPVCRQILRDAVFPKLVTFEHPFVKILRDTTLEGQRIVIPSVIELNEKSDLNDITLALEQAPGPSRTDPPHRLLKTLPLPVSRILARRLEKSWEKRVQTQGTFSISSMRHLHVRSSFPLINTSMGITIGSVEESKLTRGDGSVSKSVTLVLAFDHRLIDGAPAAEFLNDLKSGLEKRFDKGIESEG